MKLKNTCNFFALFLISVSTFSQTAACNGALPFEEKDGLLTIEMESGILPETDKRWQIGAEMETINGQEVETKYIKWTGEDSFNSLTGATIKYKIKINNPGTYRFAWRMRVGKGDKRGEHNDAWLKIDAEDFFGIKDGNKVYPKPMCNQNSELTCAAGSSINNFIKAYGNRLDWTFVTNTNDHDFHRVFVTFEEAKEYIITVDARSSFLNVDKMVLRRNGISDGVAFDLNNLESSCFDASLSTTTFNKSEISIHPNPTNGNVEIKNLPLNSKLVIRDILGATVKVIQTKAASQNIIISDLKNGVYFISNTDNNNRFIKKLVKI